jgi:hypothetical protein
MATIAQPFDNNISGGCYLTSLNLYFRSDISTNQTSEGSNTITVDVRELVNDLPSINGHLVGSRVSVILPNDKKSADGRKEFNIKFPSPVYLSEEKQYCFTLSTTNQTQVPWYGTEGERDINSNDILNTIDLRGIFVFNNGSWSSIPEKSLKYELYRAKFSKGDDYDYVFKPAQNQSEIKLPLDSIRLFKGSDIAFISIPNNGCIAGKSRITISNAFGFAGVLASSINTTHDVISASTDSVMIRLDNIATSSITGGGSDIVVTKNYEFDKFRSAFAFEKFPNTSIDWGYRFNGKTRTTYTSAPATYSNFNTDSYNYFTDNQRVFLNASSRRTEVSGISQTGKIRSRVRTERDNISPIIDLDKTSISISKTRVNNPDVINRFKVTNINLANDSTINKSGQNIIRANSITNGIFGVNVFAEASDLVGQYVFGHSIPNGSTITLVQKVAGSDFDYDITISNSLTDNLSVDNVILVHGTDSNKDYVLNYSEGSGSDRSSALSKYITKRVDLETSAPILKIIMEVNLPTEADIKVYAKTTPYSDIDFDALDWKLVNPEDGEQGVPKTNDPNRFIRVEYEHSDKAANGEIENFLSFAVKIEMLSSNSIYFPKVRNIKAIAVT